MKEELGFPDGILIGFVRRIVIVAFVEIDHAEKARTNSGTAEGRMHRQKRGSKTSIKVTAALEGVDGLEVSPLFFQIVKLMRNWTIQRIRDVFPARPGTRSISCKEKGKRAKQGAKGTLRRCSREYHSR